jgi:hypothetical protein
MPVSKRTSSLKQKYEYMNRENSQLLAISIKKSFFEMEFYILKYIWLLWN